jgi:DNA replication protein DnaC
MEVEALENSGSGVKCPKCNDSLWVESTGGMVRCDCFEKKVKLARVQTLAQQSGLRGSLLKKSFENYHPKTKQQEEVLEKVKKGGSFFLIGDFGVGKTHLLAASVNEAVKNGVSAVFFSVPWLLQMIRDDLFSNRPIGVMDIVCDVEYLALDDLGKEKATETVQEKLFMILDRREIGGLRTSVTSNYDPDTLRRDKVDGAIVSRIIGMCSLIVLEGEDYRWRGKKK